MDIELIGAIILDKQPGDRALVIFLIAVPAVLFTVSAGLFAYGMMLRF